MDQNGNGFKLSSKAFTGLVLAGAAVLIVIFMVINGGGVRNEADGCNVNFQSAWGQSPSAVWVDLNTYGENKAVATFDFEYPDEPVKGYPNQVFRAYSRQVFEVGFTDDAGNEGMRFSKAYTCNAYEIYEPKDGAFRSILRNDVDGIEVKEYGDGETVSMLFFAKGDYSYTMIMMDNPLPPAEAEALVSQLN